MRTSIVAGILVLSTLASAHGADRVYPPQDEGVVFEVDTAGQFTALYAFSGELDGGLPVHGVTRDAAGNLDGPTAYGRAFKRGVIYKIDASGGEIDRATHTETVLHSFSGYDGGQGINDPLLLINGHIYGATVDGGHFNEGVAFKFTLPPTPAY